MKFAIHFRRIAALILSLFLLAACTTPVVENGPNFSSQQQLDSHYEKHVVQQKEFGTISKQEYLKRAQQLVKSSPGGNILVKTRSNGDRLFYHKQTNEFAVLTEKGVIKTFFKPKDGVEYYNRQ